MIIDFHTHFFPEKIAGRTVDFLRERMREINHVKEPIEVAYPICSDATYADTLRCMDDNNIDISVLLPIATRDGQSDNVNNYAESVNGDRIISFGSLFPFQKDWEYVVCDLHQRGFKGIKLHPEGQQFYIDCKESIQIIKKATELGMLVIYHAGEDPGFEKPVHSTPKRILNVMQEADGSKIIAAHLGGLNQWDDVEKYLVGSPIYMDTSYVSKVIDKEQYKRIIRTHGAEKIVFGSDCPWQEPKETIEGLISLGLDEEELNMIKSENAKRILGIE